MNATSETTTTNSRVALITGSGAPRIGNVVARRLAVKGYAVVLHANRSHDLALATADELRRSGHEALALHADLLDESAIAKLVEQAGTWGGGIDALVNCAAIWKPTRLEEVTAAQVTDHFAVNTLGTFLFCQHVGLRMTQQTQGGAIVNIGDWATCRPYLDYAAYFASKGSIPTLTRDFAVELAARNTRVRVNAVLPGPVMLPETMSSDERQAVIAQTLLKREGSPEHVAHAVEFLLENDFITGVCLPVDGGRTIASSG